VMFGYGKKNQEKLSESRGRSRSVD
jgi:hypothetical protein